MSKKNLGKYENPQRYFKLRGVKADSLSEALKQTFTNPKTGKTNWNLVRALESRQASLFKASARQADYGRPELLKQALTQFYGSDTLADAAIKSGFKAERRAFLVERTRGEGYLKKRYSLTAFARKVHKQLEGGTRSIWATTRGTVRLVSNKQAAAWRRQSKVKLL